MKSETTDSKLMKNTDKTIKTASVQPENVRSGSTILTRTIQQNNRSGTFSAKADYTPVNDGNVRIDDWIFDSLGILPNGTETRILPLAEAQAEYRERKANGWTT